MTTINSQHSSVIVIVIIHQVLFARSTHDVLLDPLEVKVHEQLSHSLEQLVKNGKDDNNHNGSKQLCGSKEQS